MERKKQKKTSGESLPDLELKGKRLEALINLGNTMRDPRVTGLIHFNDFLFNASQFPELVFRDIFQFFHDMVNFYVPEGVDEYEKNENTIGFMNYDFRSLFVSDTEDPFFSDRLFANRLMNLVKEFKKGIQNNHIYLFEGPPGSGKSTFLNNLLARIEAYNHTLEGAMYRTVWRLDIRKLGGFHPLDLAQPHDESVNGTEHSGGIKYLEIACPSNDHPILQIPRNYRERFLRELIHDKKFLKKIRENKEYRWVLRDTPCSVCTSLYNRLSEMLPDPLEVFKMMYARKTGFDRQFGQGISVFNPADDLFKKPITDPTLQTLINRLLKTDKVRYVYSHLANTNNGVYAIMDIKENNVQRLKDLHGIISDGVHKVELAEERIRSLFVGLVNPEDKIHYEDIKSFQDRVTHINISYVLDYDTEVAIYRHKFGHDIDKFFLPRILENFAKIIISSRLEPGSPTLENWIRDPGKYEKYLDDDMFLLKMELYKGNIPVWLSEEDERSFTRQKRTDLLEESEQEGMKGISGRQSLSIFNSFMDKYAEKDKLINMGMLKEFFKNNDKTGDEIPEAFVDALERMYNYDVLQEVKEAVYYFSEKQIRRDILNYLFAINYEPGATERSEYTGDTIEITEDYFKNFEALYLGTLSTPEERMGFRSEHHNDYITYSLAYEIKVEGKDITETKQFKNLFDKYTRNLKENAMKAYAGNENFRMAIRDYNSPAFANFDDNLKRTVTRMICTLKNKFGYSEEGARQVSLYVIDNNLDTDY